MKKKTKKKTPPAAGNLSPALNMEGEKATRETSSLNEDMSPEWYQSSFSLPNEIH